MNSFLYMIVIATISLGCRPLDQGGSNLAVSIESPFPPTDEAVLQEAGEGYSLGGGCANGQCSSGPTFQAPIYPRYVPQPKATSAASTGSSCPGGVCRPSADVGARPTPQASSCPGGVCRQTPAGPIVRAPDATPSAPQTAPHFASVSNESLTFQKLNGNREWSGWQAGLGPNGEEVKFGRDRIKQADGTFRYVTYVRDKDGVVQSYHKRPDGSLAQNPNYAAVYKKDSRDYAYFNKKPEDDVIRQVAASNNLSHLDLLKKYANEGIGIYTPGTAGSKGKPVYFEPQIFDEKNGQDKDSVMHVLAANQRDAAIDSWYVAKDPRMIKYLENPTTQSRDKYADAIANFTVYNQNFAQFLGANNPSFYSQPETQPVKIEVKQEEPTTTAITPAKTPQTPKDHLDPPSKGERNHTGKFQSIPEPF